MLSIEFAVFRCHISDTCSPRGISFIRVGGAKWRRTYIEGLESKGRLGNFTMPMRSLLAAILTASLIFGCTSKTMLITNPPGAEVYVNDEYYGKSPTEYGDSRIVGAFVARQVERTLRITPTCVAAAAVLCAYSVRTG